MGKIKPGLVFAIIADDVPHHLIRCLEFDRWMTLLTLSYSIAIYQGRNYT